MRYVKLEMRFEMKTKINHIGRDEENQNLNKGIYALIFINRMIFFILFSFLLITFSIISLFLKSIPNPTMTYEMNFYSILCSIGNVA